MSEHLNFIVLGLGNGAVFAALAMALVTTFRSSGVVNFATGALALHAAYTYAFLRRGLLLIPIPGLPETIELPSGLAVVPAILVTVAIEAVVGVVLYLVVFRPLRNRTAMAKAVASLGVMVLFTAAMTHQAGGDQVLVTPILPRSTWSLGELRFLGDRVWFVVVIVAISLALGAVNRFTRFGLSTRAVAETEVGAFVSGLSPERVSLVNWALSAAVAAVAGVLIAPLVPLVPGTYTLFIVPALAAAVLGQFSALAPAVAGGLLIGMLQAEAVFLQSRYDWFPTSGVAELIPLVFVLVVLVVRGRPLPTRGTLMELRLGRAPRPRSVRTPTAVLVPLAIVAIYAFGDSYRSALIESMIFAVLALSLVVVTGYLGQVSLAQLTIAGCAAFLLSGLSDGWGVPFPFAPLLAALGATAIGVVVGLPALRIRGMLVAVVTLTMATAFEAFWFRNNDFNGGPDGAQIVDPSIFGIDLGIGSGAAFPRPEFGLLCLFVLTVVAVLVAQLRRSRLGSAMLAVRANERSAAAAGISVTRVKLVGFALGAFIAGLGGCLLAYKQTTVTFQSYSVLLGLAVFSTVYLAGVTSVSGGLVAGLAAVSGLGYVFLERSIEVGQWYGIVSGIGVILAVILNPDGFVGSVQETVARHRRSKEPLAVIRLDAPVDLADGASASIAPAEGGAALVVDGVGVEYGGVVALQGVSITIPRGAIVGIIGPNGAGKTTLIDAICGFARSSGSVSVAGEEVSALRPHERARRGLARTFQGVDLYEDLTVEENVMVGQHVSGRHAPPLDEVLRQLGLDGLRDRHVDELSQGQRQLVSVARALASEPAVLLLDEPAAGLDSSESAWLAERLRSIRATGVTIVLIDHDMQFVMNLCDQIHVLDLGKQIASGSAAAIQSDRRVTEAYLGAGHVAVGAAQ